MSEWQEMEDAPTDGSRVQLYCKGNGITVYGPIYGWYGRTYSAWIDDRGDKLNPPPTHWMPPPEPPA